MARLGMLIDTSKCTACRGCQVACKQWNDLPAEKTKFFAGSGYQNPKDLSGVTLTLVTFKERVSEKKVEWLFRKHQCMQCQEASCVNVCPVKAMSKHSDGYAIRDEAKCIGCGMCVMNCPFKVPKLNEKRKAHSCKFCADRVQNNLMPACAKTCLSGAILFGKKDELLAKAKERVNILGGKANIYGEKECGGLGVLYLLLDNPEVYGLPKAPKSVEGIPGAFFSPFEQIALLTSGFGLCLNKLAERKEALKPIPEQLRKKEQ
ncbi:MAG: 4Fe-4S dicluster domain-containing protein [bacterium]|nr:4Fe-4S dicluster domain-containing protein [bacterium]